MASPSLPLTQKLIQEVATYTDSTPLELPPLYHTIDPESVETCIDRLSEGTLSFEYAGVAITIDSTGSIDIENEDSASAQVNGRGLKHRGT